MEKHLYKEMAEMEATHWWFRSRRKIIKAIIHSKIDVTSSVSILDAGCGTGGNFELWKELSNNISGMELDDYAREIAQEKAHFQVLKGELPNEIPFPDESFDLIVLLDVLEHIDNDNQALRSLARKLKPGGHLLVTVPAYQFLWGVHDEVHHHKRRYLASEMVDKMRHSGLVEVYNSYFNSLLFIPIFLLRILKRFFPLVKDGHGDANPTSKGLNFILEAIMSSEVALLHYLRLPFGVSIVALGKKVE